MSLWAQWTQRPQSVWARKALFQVHLWVGVSAGLYILLISVSGSMIVYRRELTRMLSRDPLTISISGPRLSPDDMKQSALRAYPGYEVNGISKPRRQDQAVDVALKRDGASIERLFNPYTGADLGNPVRPGFRALQWFVDLHDNLLAGQTGRIVNLCGAIFLTVLCLTGAVIWWPGVKAWRRGLTVDGRANFLRFNWDLHSALGIWSLLFIFLWGISGIYLSIPQFFNRVVDYLEPVSRQTAPIRTGDYVLYWLAQLHFGRFSGWYVKALWTTMGLVPAALFITGALMWWNRVLRKIPR